MRGLIVPLAAALVIFVATPAVADRDFAVSNFDRSGVEVAATHEEGSSGEKEEGRGSKPVKGAPGAKIPKGANQLAKDPTSVATEDTSDSKRRLDVFIPECWDGMVEKAECRAAPPEEAAPTDPQQPTAPRPAPPTRAQAEALARTLVGRLDLPESTPLVGPDPGVNEWNMAVVGYPLWLWVECLASGIVSHFGV